MMQKSVKWMAAAFGAALVLTAVTLMLHGTDNKSTRLALELTARFSFVLFWLAYAGGAIATLFRVDALAGRGREFGLAFAAAHLVHVGLVIWLGVLMGRVIAWRLGSGEAGRGVPTSRHAPPSAQDGIFCG